MTWFTWLGLALAVVIVVTFVVQILLGRIEGFVTRAMASIGIAVGVLAVATVMVLVVTGGTGILGPVG